MAVEHLSLLVTAAKKPRLSLRHIRLSRWLVVSVPSWTTMSAMCVEVPDLSESFVPLLCIERAMSSGLEASEMLELTRSWPVR